MDSRAAKPVVSADRTSVEQFAADVRYYLSLTPRQLPSRYLYDDLGSALFESICRLPWYTITRAELRLLTAHGDSVFRRLPSLSRVVELGPGNGEKLRTLLEAASRRPIVRSFLHGYRWVAETPFASVEAFSAYVERYCAAGFDELLFYYPPERFSPPGTVGARVFEQVMEKRP